MAKFVDSWDEDQLKKKKKSIGDNFVARLKAKIYSHVTQIKKMLNPHQLGAS